MPPAPQEVQAFLSGAETYEQAVDRLLASPRYAERMTARWLDAGEQVDAVPMPAHWQAVVARFAAEHYKPAPKRARKRDRQAAPVPRDE